MSNNNGPHIPEGKYIARATGAEWGVTDRGKDFCAVNFKISEGEIEGERITAYLYFSTDENSRRSVESLRYCGCSFPGNDVTDLEGLGSIDCQLVVEHEEWEGKTRAKVKWINALRGAGVREEQKMNAGARRSFAARMKAAVIATGGGQPSATKQAPPPVDDSDIPY